MSDSAFASNSERKGHAIDEMFTNEDKVGCPLGSKESSDDDQKNARLCREGSS